MTTTKLIAPSTKRVFMMIEPENDDTPEMAVREASKYSGNRRLMWLTGWMGKKLICIEVDLD